MSQHTGAYRARVNPRPANTTIRTGDAMGGQHWAPLALLSCLLFFLLLVLVVPVADWGTLPLYLVIAAIAGVLLYRKGIRPLDPQFPAALFLLALTCKGVASLGRFWTAVDLYGGAADALLYHEQGQFVAQYFRAFDFSLFEWYKVRAQGTTEMVYITGVLYSLLPANFPGSFLFFALLAFAGAVFFYRSIRLARPGASTFTYGLLLFFLPSILFWPSSLGKDSWIFLWSGVITWGWAVYITRQRLPALVLCAFGLLMINLIRPHIAAFFVLAMGGAYFLYATKAMRSAVAWLAGGVILVGLIVVLVQSGAEFLQLEELSLEAVQEFYLEQQALTTIGGSRYKTVNIFTPSGALIGLITALARPFPWEAHNVQTLLTSFETVVWLMFCWLQRKVFFQRLRTLRSDPFAAFALFYSLAILAALTSIGNFGIIARQRVMALPFWWMLFI